MPKEITDAKRRANAKWNGENLGTLGCTVQKEKAEQFKAYAKSKNTTVNALLREFVDSCLANDQTAAPVPPEQGSGEE